MKITSVEILQLRPDDGNAIGVKWNPTVIKINTDEGIYGLGEIGLAYSDAKAGQVGVAKDFASRIVGMDPFKIESIWEMLYRKTFWGMGGGTFVFSAMSGIDIALWDLKGKALNVPVYELLGGKTNDKLRTYASQIQWDWDVESKSRVTNEEYAEAARKAVSQGFDCVKVNPIGHDADAKWMNWKMTGSLTPEQIRVAVERTEAIRNAIGDNIDLIIELHCHTDANSAVQLARALEPYNILYLEEPTAPLNWKSMKYIADNVSMPLATGERTYTRLGFRPFIENQVVTLIQPDLGNCGGITEGKKICDMANTYDIGVQCHQCGGPLATAAALQLEAVIPNFVIHEHNNQSLLPSNRELCLFDLQPKNGYFEVPDRPGIGNDLTEKAYKNADKYVVK